MKLHEFFDCGLCGCRMDGYGTFVLHMAQVHLIEGPFQMCKDPNSGHWEYIRPVKDSPKEDS